MCRYIMKYEDFWRLFEKGTGMGAPLDELLKLYRK